jgi:hypothetical protein
MEPPVHTVIATELKARFREFINRAVPGHVPFHNVVPFGTMWY